MSCDILSPDMDWHVKRSLFTIRRTALIHSLALMLMAGSAPDAQAQSTPPKREFRAAWVATVSNLDWPSTNRLSAGEQQQEMVTLLDQLHASGINAIIFQVRTECDALYNSPYEPWSYYLTGNQGTPPSPFYDPLAFTVAEAHKRGMEVHAWFNPYRVLRSSLSYPKAYNHVSVQHPEWVITSGGTTILDPGLPAVREHVAKVVLDIVTRYDVDGIHADDYFYPYPPDQLTTQDDASYLANNPGGLTKDDWRRNNVNTLIRTLYDSVQIIKPHVKFGMSPFGIWKSGIPTGITGLSAYSTIYCDAVAWLQGQYIDYLTPQLYWQIGGSQDYLKLMPWWATQLNGRHLYPGHAPYRIVSSNWTASELPNQVRADRDRRAENVLGSVFFRARNGITDNPKGFADSLRIDLYRYRALMPQMSWKDPVPPLAAANLRYTDGADAPAHLQWDVPSAATDGDTASMYVVYRYANDPGLTPDIDDPAGILYVTAPSSFDAPVPSSSSGSYFYTVTSLDRNHNESGVSNVIEVASPAVPTAMLPADSTTGLPDSIMFVWNRTDATSRYTVEIRQADQPGTLFLTRTLTDTMTSASGFDGQKTYMWQVRSGNAGGSSSYSSASYFTTGFPATPLLAYPTDALPNVPFDVDLTWRTTQGAESYRLQFSTNSTFATTEIDTSVLTDTVFTVTNLASYKIYFWRIQATNAVGDSRWSAVFRFRTQTATNIAASEDVPGSFQLYQNYPNPFNPSTIIRFALPADATVSLRIYDILGREVRRLIDGNSYSAGIHSVTWFARDDRGVPVSNGVYLYRIEAGGYMQVKRMVLLR